MLSSLVVSRRTPFAIIALQKAVGVATVMTGHQKDCSASQLRRKDRKYRGLLETRIVNVFLPSRLSRFDPHYPVSNRFPKQRLHASAHDFVSFFVAFISLISSKMSLSRKAVIICFLVPIRCMLLEGGFVRGRLEILPASLADDRFGCGVLQEASGQHRAHLTSSEYLRISTENLRLLYPWLRARACSPLSLRCPSRRLRCVSRGVRRDLV